VAEPVPRKKETKSGKKGEKSAVREFQPDGGGRRKLEREEKRAHACEIKRVGETKTGGKTFRI